MCYLRNKLKKRTEAMPYKFDLLHLWPQILKQTIISNQFSDSLQRRRRITLTRYTSCGITVAVL
jgi:hypothetical protein